MADEKSKTTKLKEKMNNEEVKYSEKIRKPKRKNYDGRTEGH